MAANPLIIGASQRAALAELRAKANADPIDMADAIEVIKTPAGRAAHIDRMNRLSVSVPTAFMVTFSIERHPGGIMRHMSMSTARRGGSPTPAAVWMVCQELGYVGAARFDGCNVWVEDLAPDQGSGHGKETAINVIQPIAMTDSARA